MKSPLVIYWARRDLRVHDNPALLAAVQKSTEAKIPFLPLFVLEEYMTKGDPAHQFGYPSRWFLAQALPVFAQQFKNFTLVHAKAAAYFSKLSKNYELTIHVNDDVYIDFYTQVKKLEASGITVVVHEDALSVPKDTASKEGNLYSVFTPFKKNVWAHFIKQKPLSEPKLDEVMYLEDSKLAAFENQLPLSSQSILEVTSKKRLITVAGEMIDLDEYTKLPKLEGWYVSEAEALEHFKQYLKSGALDAYRANRDSLELDVASEKEEKLAARGKTSRMSLALAWGLVSSRTLLHLAQKHFDDVFDNPFSTGSSEGTLTYISELIWREFYRYQLYHHPELMDTEFQKRFRGTIAWIDEAHARTRFIAWIKGETGYPVVDAAMKQLAETGWMHNRSRMIVASILSKNLGVDWRWGQEYFRAVLIDLDEASNNGGWQWGASVGADPKPIRIFNPELQAKNYDASGAYQKRWLQSDENFSLLAPSVPIVEHKVAREEALQRYGLSKEEEPRDY